MSDTTDDEFHIRAMSRGELDLAIEWAAAEGWNPGLHDAEAFFAADPGGYLVGVSQHVPVASISVVGYGAGEGFLGLYIVHPDHRGKGFGRKLWQAGMEQMSNRNVGLDAVVAQQDAYRRAGFSLAWNNQRFEGVGGGTAPIGPVPLASLPFERVAAYDTRMFTMPRDAFLRRWIGQPGSTALGYVANGDLAGYGVIRACRRGHKIGPLFADSPDVAESLFQGLAATVPGEPVFLDIAQPNAEAQALVQRHGMTPVFETARMYTGGDPGVPLDRLYGITSFELG